MNTILTPEREQAMRNYMWSEGVLDWKLQHHQETMYNNMWDFINAGDDAPLTYCVNCSRRFGKTSVLLIIAVEFCLRQNNRIVRFAMPWQGEATEIIRHFFNLLFQDCPEDIKPTQYKQDGYWAFANGSELQIHGVNNNQENKLRGHESHLCIVDEAGSIDQLRYLTSDVLLPQLLTSAGRMVVASTPSPVPGHYYKTMYDKCKLGGSLSEYTIYDNTSLSPAIINAWCKESGGVASSTWKREYLIMFEVDEDRMIIPEWKKEYVVDTVRPDYFQYYFKYVGMDLGVINDYTAILFGYYNFEEGILYVEDEITSRGSNQTTEALHDKMVAKEKELDYKKMDARIVDNNNPQLVQDMKITHNYFMQPVHKTSLIGMISKLRTFIDSGRLRISPKCEMLIGCLETAWWNTGSSKDKIAGKNPTFGRDDTYSHFDHLAALMYMIRGINDTTNPIPVIAYARDSTHHIPEKLLKPVHLTKSMQNLANALNRKPR